ncbi:hypothetical protein MNB_SV-14-124 [hydrothermal vent metagenome]|uniref:Uncharacterized protein n=1 Tax=hydrothermal vent metagenome TaxID=652676 RepID=A0A1W1BLZ4_9ZZZZ
MKKIKEKIVLITSIFLINGCATDTSKLTTALSDGVQAGVKTSMDKNSTNATLKNSLIEGTKVGLKSALDSNSTKSDNNSSESMTTKVIDNVADYLKDGKKKKD